MAAVAATGVAAVEALVEAAGLTVWPFPPEQAPLTSAITSIAPAKAGPVACVRGMTDSRFTAEWPGGTAPRLSGRETTRCRSRRRRRLRRLRRGRNRRAAAWPCRDR